ncbi:hypothetical protein ACS0TY_002657 [Phlomoides rotata]
MAAPEVNAADSGGAPVVTPLYVANLDANVTDLQLYDLFSQVGDVVSVRIFRNWSSGLLLGYGYVNYANRQCAQRALEKLNFTPVNGKPIKIMHSHKEPSISKSGAGNIYIRNLEKEIDNETLHEIFSSFGHILSCKVARDASGQSMGYGFVQFSGQESARKAIAELNGMLLKGKKVNVQPYLSKQERELLVDEETFTNVFIKNFCESTTEEDLKNIFGEFGFITSAHVMRNNDGTSKCFGFVNFANSKDAARAVESLNGKIFEKKEWYVGRAQTKFERQQEIRHQLECVKEAFDEGSNLYVKNLDDSIGDKKLKELFSPFGSVTSCRVIQDEKGLSTGRGMVAFSSPEEASRALSELNGKIFGGKPLYVTLALRKEDRRARLQNLEKGIDRKAVPETLSSFGRISCEVATDASGQSMGCGFLQFSGEESAEKAIEVHNGNGVSLNEKQVCEGTGLIKQENELSLDKAKFSNVFVKNFCESTTEDGLKHIFGEFGEISSTMVMRNEDGTSKCSGYVCFKNTEDAARAVESLDGQKFGNKKWHVRRAHQQFERQLEQTHYFEQLVKESIDKGSNLHVKNLDQSIDNEKLKELFSTFGSVTSCRVMLDRNGISRGRGFVAFSSPEEASSAISEMNGKVLVGKPINVALAQRKHDRIAQLQLDKKIDHKTLQGMLPSSCKVSADASGQSMDYGYVHFAGVESTQKAIRELNGIVGKLNGIVGKLNGVIGELNVIVTELNGTLLHGKQVYAGPFLNKQENKLLVYKANLSNVFVENFCDTTTEDDLKIIFGEFGPITSTVVMRNEDGTSKCFGIVSFENAEDAARAVESLKGQKFDKKSYVGRAQKEPEKLLKLKQHSEKCVKETVDKGSNLHVKNPDNSNGGRLSEVFSPFRSVTSCKVMCNKKGISRVRGRVALSLLEESFRALSEVNGKIVSWPLYVALSLRKEDRRARLQAVPSTTLMQNMVVPLVPQQQLGSHPGGRPTNAAPMQKGLQPSQQILPRGCGYSCPHGRMLSLQYEIGGSPLHDVITFQPVPIRPSASSLFANASPLGRGRLVKCCMRLLNNWSLR